MAYWLMKSEPEAYSWDQLLIDHRTKWDGVRNHQAANYMRAMAKGDEVFFYHSCQGREIVGIARITKTAYPDKTDPLERFVCVDLVPVRALRRPVTLKELKEDRLLKEMAVVRQVRLSVSPVTAEAWERVLAISETEPRL